MPANVSIEYQKAEAEYLQAKTDEEKLQALEEMWKYRPQHKGAENLRANLRARIKKLKEKIEAKKKKKAGKKEGIKKQGTQIVLCGLTQSGKSALLSCLTNAKPEISLHPYTTTSPILGSLQYEGIQFQIIDMPAIEHENFDQGLANSADILLIMITNLSELNQILPFLEKARGKKIVVVSKSDLLDEKEKRKISSFLQSKKYDFVLVSSKTQEGIEELKKKLAENSGVIRIYTKQPGKQADEKPLLLKPNSTIKDLARKLRIPEENIKKARITGPSSKFPNQVVGLNHVLKDKDIVELYTR